MATAQTTGRTVTIVSNNSSAAITTYLGDHQLTRYVTTIVGRDDADPALMKPSPYRVRMAISQLDASPDHAFLVGIPQPMCQQAVWRASLSLVSRTSPARLSYWPELEPTP